jgi:signal peptidase II
LLREKKWRGFLLPLVAILILVIDRISKRVVMANLRPGESWNPVAALERWVSLTYVTNTGAAFGLFPDYGGIFMIIAVVVVVVIVVYHRYLPGEQWLVQISLGLQLGGALGNLLDRLRYGHVIDFIDFKVWPIFNVADSSLFVGVVILAFHLLRHGEDWGLEIRD